MRKIKLTALLFLVCINMPVIAMQQGASSEDKPTFSEDVSGKDMLVLRLASGNRLEVTREEMARIVPTAGEMKDYYITKREAQLKTLLLGIEGLDERTKRKIEISHISLTYLAEDVNTSNLAFIPEGGNITVTILRCEFDVRRICVSEISISKIKESEKGEFAYMEGGNWRLDIDTDKNPEFKELIAGNLSFKEILCVLGDKEILCSMFITSEGKKETIGFILNRHTLDLLREQENSSFLSTDHVSKVFNGYIPQDYVPKEDLITRIQLAKLALSAYSEATRALVARANALAKSVDKVKELGFECYVYIKHQMTKLHECIQDPSLSDDERQKAIKEFEFTLDKFDYLVTLDNFDYLVNKSDAEAQRAQAESGASSSSKTKIRECCAMDR